MKIVPKAVESYLAKPDPAHRAVLVYGPDAGLVRERTRRICSAFVSGSQDPFALTELKESQLASDPALLADELSAISMMVPRRAVLVRDGSDKLTRLIEGAADCFHDGVLLVVSSEELSPRSSLRGWFEKSSQAASIACYHDDMRDVRDVIRKAFDTNGIRASRDVVDYLAQQLGNDRYVTYQELEKLVAYAGEKKAVELEDAQALVDYNREASFDDMINAVADRNLSALDRTLTLLLREGTQPVAYLRALQRYFNRLYLLRAQMHQSGQSAEQIIPTLRPPVFFRQIPILARHLQNWNNEAIVKALRLLAAAELACKTSDIPVIPASTRRLLQVTQIR